MKSLTVRGVDEDVYEALRDLASRNHRSMQEHVKMILEREVSLSTGGHLQRCLSLRERLQGRDWGDVAADIRYERAR
jgi:plasmid stability protein